MSARSKFPLGLPPRISSIAVYHGGLGEDVCTAGGFSVELPIASRGDGGSTSPDRTTAPMPKQAKTKAPHQHHRVAWSQRPRITRGGVIARVWISTRQKLKRPLRSTKAHLEWATNATTFHRDRPERWQATVLASDPTACSLEQASCLGRSCDTHSCR